MLGTTVDLETRGEDRSGRVQQQEITLGRGVREKHEVSGAVQECGDAACVRKDSVI